MGEQKVLSNSNKFSTKVFVFILLVFVLVGCQKGLKYSVTTNDSLEELDLQHSSEELARIQSLMDLEKEQLTEVKAVEIEDGNKPLEIKENQAQNTLEEAEQSHKQLEAKESEEYKATNNSHEEHNKIGGKDQKREKAVQTVKTEVQTASSAIPKNGNELIANPTPNLPMIDTLLPKGNSRERETDVTNVMIHFMSNGAVNSKAPYNMKDIRSIFTKYGVSAHYVIDRNGTIHRFVSEDRVAFHAGKGNLPGHPHLKDKMNDYSIGIELLAIGTREEMLAIIPNFPYDSISLDDVGYTDAQYQSLNALLNDIYSRYNTISKSRNHVIGHDEYAPTRKTDPGSLFDWRELGF